jgi:copper chaperone CopZ
MSCQSCVSHAKKALEAVQGVRSVLVNLEKEEAIVQHEGADAAKLVEAIVEEGYAASMEK